MSMTRMAMIAALALASAQAIAANREHGKKDHQMLTDAAQALQATKPDLAERLQKYAVREAGEMQGVDADRPQDLQMLREAAAALDKVKPNLAKKVRKFADKEEKEMGAGMNRGTDRGTRGGNRGTEPTQTPTPPPSQSPTGY